MTAMDRLRTARPASVPIEADREALFDRIVAAPPTGAGAVRPAAGASSCSSPPSAWWSH